MKDTVQNLAGGKGNVRRSIRKIEFGTLVLDPMARIGKHAHTDEEQFKHCEIYITFSRYVLVNKKYRLFSICRNSEHEAWNRNTEKYGKIYFIKLWW